MIAWLSSKVSLLIFGVVAFTAVMGLALFVRNFSALDASQRDAAQLAHVVDSVCSAPVSIENMLSFNGERQLASGKRGSVYFISVQGIDREVHCPVAPASFNSTSVKIAKASGIVRLTRG